MFKCEGNHYIPLKQYCYYDFNFLIPGFLNYRIQIYIFSKLFGNFVAVNIPHQVDITITFFVYNYHSKP